MNQSGVSLNAVHEALVEALAENDHNIWARELIRQGWSYAPQQVEFTHYRNVRTVCMK